MSFLPEDDRDYLATKFPTHRLITEKLPDGSERNGVLIPDFPTNGNLRMENAGALVACQACEVLVVVPSGYSTTKLDSFYTLPRLKRPDGTDPQNANGDTDLFGRKWQFWSRHLDEKDWRLGVDGLPTYFSYVAQELRQA